ncbi:MAG: hypothetical protein NTZ90_11705 [Proteobacteria bacterium]|nr:hypothetical protein [Pseudomonadota bacterium]
MAIQTLMHQRAGTIRRVVRRGMLHICGLCRRQYSDEGDAHECVVSCWTELLSLDPVLPRRALAVVNYRCRFCARDYRARSLAYSCAKLCRRQMIDAFDLEEELFLAGEGTDARPRRRVKPRPVAQARVQRTAPKLKRTVEAPAVVPEAPVNEDATSAAAAAAAAATGAAAAAATEAAEGGAEKGKKYKDGDIFTRDGARYICKVCKKKHFTREDVVACFESHSEAGGATG